MNNCPSREDMLNYKETLFSGELLPPLPHFHWARRNEIAIWHRCLIYLTHKSKSALLRLQCLTLALVYLLLQQISRETEKQKSKQTNALAIIAVHYIQFLMALFSGCGAHSSFPPSLQLPHNFAFFFLFFFLTFHFTDHGTMYTTHIYTFSSSTILGWFRSFIAPHPQQTHTCLLHP